MHNLKQGSVKAALAQDGKARLTAGLERRTLWLTLECGNLWDERSKYKLHRIDVLAEAFLLALESLKAGVTSITISSLQDDHRWVLKAQEPNTVHVRVFGTVRALRRKFRFDHDDMIKMLTDWEVGA